jgi:restriction system protein
VSTSDDHLEEVLAVLRDDRHSVPEESRAVEKEEEPEDEEAFDLYTSAVQETEDYLLRAWHRTGTTFERVVAAVLEAMGYTATVTRACGDHGVDVIAHPDALGLEAPFIKVQVKSGTSSAGEPEVSQLLGSIESGEKGIFVSLGGFTSQALSKARNNSTRITLIDAARFVKLFLDHYETLDPTWRGKFPLGRVYVPRKA